MMPKFRAAMFDMDGTLLHTMRYWRLTTIEMLLGRNIFPTPEQMGRVFSSSSRALCKEVLLEHGIEMTDMEILRELESYMLHHYRQDATMKARADEYLARLHASGIPMCIATAAPKEFAAEVLTRLGLIRYFDFITDCYEQKIKKNDPEFFRRMAAKMGVEAHEMCVFEDALYSIKTAKEAGCPVIAFEDATQLHDRDEIIALADVFVNGYDELLK